MIAGTDHRQNRAARRQRPTIQASGGRTDHRLLFVSLLLACTAGCVSDKPNHRDSLASYQQNMAERSPQRMIELEEGHSSDPLNVLRPYASPERRPLSLASTTDPVSHKEMIQLSLGQAIVWALDNNPSIREVSFDPEIAGQQIRQAAAEFDPAAFARASYDQQGNPVNSIFQPGESESRTAESGLKQKLPTGTEWSAAYTLAREWDDLFGRTLATRYEPFVVFDLRQPLLRDASSAVNLAGVNIAKLNRRIAMLDFHQRTDEVVTRVVAAYWLLWQACRDLQINQELLDQAVATLRKVQGRIGIDATDVQSKQAETSKVVREALLVRARQRIRDAQDNLLTLTADPQLNLLTDVELNLSSPPAEQVEKLGESALLRSAMLGNPRLEQARVVIEIADLNVRVAENQKLPCLDLTGSTRTQGFREEIDDAHGPLGKGQYVSYAVGLSLELPLGNCQRDAVLQQRRIERRKALAALTDAADQVALSVKEGIRRVETNSAEIVIHKGAEEAALGHLLAMEQSEQMLQRLTPEFLLVKLQAQESLASVRHDLAEATARLNISLTELARATGRVLELHGIRASEEEGQPPSK